MPKTVKVMGTEACGGTWGNLHQGQVAELDASVAESLVNAGWAVHVDDKNKPVLDRRARQAMAGKVVLIEPPVED